MASILVDNWTLEQAITNLHNLRYGLTEISPELVSLIETIVLWDEVYYFDKSESYLWQRLLKEDYDKNPFKRVKEPEVEEWKLNEAFPDCNSFLHGRSAAEYEMKSRALGLDLIVHGKRADYFLGKKDQLIRLNLLNQIDSALAQYYKEILPNKNLCFQFPAIFDYIRTQVKEGADYFEAALDLRHQPSVNRFREWLNEYEEAESRGDWDKQGRMELQLQGVLSQIVKPSSGIKAITVEGSIGLLPGSILNLSTQKKIDFYPRTIKHTFLRKIVKKAKTARPL